MPYGLQDSARFKIDAIYMLIDGLSVVADLVVQSTIAGSLKSRGTEQDGAWEVTSLLLEESEVVRPQWLFVNSALAQCADALKAMQPWGKTRDDRLVRNAEMHELVYTCILAGVERGYVHEESAGTSHGPSMAACREDRVKQVHLHLLRQCPYTCFLFSCHFLVGSVWAVVDLNMFCR